MSTKPLFFVSCMATSFLSISCRFWDISKITNRRPIGTKMCKTVCQSLYGCVTFQYDHFSLECEVGKFQKNSEDSTVYSLTKPMEKLIPPHCPAACTYINNKFGQETCVKYGNRLGVHSNRSNEHIQRTFNMTADIQNDCQCFYDKCDNNNIPIARKCLHNLSIAMESTQSRRNRGKVIEFIVRLTSDFTCNLSMGVNGITLLEFAADYGLINIVRCVLSRGNYKLDARENARRRKSAILIAVRMQHVNIFELFLKAGTRLEIQQDKKRLTVLHAACNVSRSNHVLVDMILDECVDVDSRLSNGYTPLMLAAKRGNLEAFKHLIARGSDVTLVDDRNMTVLHIAVTAGRYKIVRYILSRKLVDMELRDIDGRTAVFHAINDFMTFAILIDNGCDLSVSDAHGNTLLHAACGEGTNEINILKIIKSCKECGRHLKQKNPTGETPLQIVRNRDFWTQGFYKTLSRFAEKQR